MIDIICCNGYGLARCIAVPTPVILQDGYASSAPTVTPENYQDLLNDPASTICELDDGTKAIGIHSKITTYDCDGSNPQDWWYVHEWAFVGSDNKVRTVTNTYGGNPAAMVNGASEWVPFKWTNPERQAIVYEYIDGEIGPIIVRDRDITGQRCNFYIEDTGVYEGTDVSVENGDMDAGFEFQYTYPLDQQAICDAGIMQDQCTIYKTINNYRLIDTGTVNNRNPFMRYEIEQGLDIDVKISQKGILTNSKYTGKYEILNSRVRTGTFSDIDKLEQGTRKDTKYGGEGQYPLIVNDREAVAKFDRIRGNSNNYYSNVDVIQDLKLYYEDQTRSVWSENGIVHILDKDLGMIEVDMWGQ
jgi:hypothetical protein